MDLKNTIHVLGRAVIMDQDHILLCKTVGLEPDFYFLPGGHIEHGESMQAGLLRELVEETGAECIIKRFLGCLEYSFDPGSSRICHSHEYNFIFEVESEHLKIKKKMLQLEEHIALIWQPMQTLSTIDFRAAALKELIPAWIKLPPANVFASRMQ
jgi:8-oxo-dGTP diphosphatase